MKKIITLLIILLIIISFYFLFLRREITGFVINSKDYYSYTKAICNETNYCQDYEIICENKKVVSIKPITGAAIQQPPNWKDPRDKDTIEKMCG